MPYSTVILSPQYHSHGRVEAINTAVGVMRTGIFVSLDPVAGTFIPTPAGAARTYISTENISTAQDIEYQYAENELMFAAALPSGCRVAVAAGANVEYLKGSLVEIGNNGLTVIAADGTPVGVVAHTVTPQVGEHIAIDLFDGVAPVAPVITTAGA